MYVVLLQQVEQLAGVSEQNQEQSGVLSKTQEQLSEARVKLEQLDAMITAEKEQSAHDKTAFSVELEQLQTGCSKLQEQVLKICLSNTEKKDVILICISLCVKYNFI